MTAPADFTTSDQVLGLYRKRAKHYNVAAALYGLIGFRYRRYRRVAIDGLKLSSGDTVVDIGCGTGKNFAALVLAVGSTGRVIGVDLTDAMLAEAGKRVRANGWGNVELVESPAAAYRFPGGIAGILSTFAITLEPEYDAVIARGAQALKPGGRWAIVDFREPTDWRRALADPLIFLSRPFGVTRALAVRHPWESMDRYLRNVSIREFYWGTTYVATGEA